LLALPPRRGPWLARGRRSCGVLLECWNAASIDNSCYWFGTFLKDKIEMVGY
jgi:hypothetical protein